MLEESRAVKSLGRLFRAVRPEDLIGLKVQASSNNPDRKQDLVDIEEILRANHGNLDVERIRRYYELFDRQEELDAILAKLDGF